MASPDFSSYIDLTINDLQPGDIYDEAIDYGRISLPEFSPRAGTIEDAVLQATSYVAAEAISNINRLPDGLMEGILRFMNILRIEASFGSASVQFTVSNPEEIVPSGTIAVFETTDGDVRVQYPFELLTEVVAEENETTVVGILTSQIPGILPSITPGTLLSLSQPSSTVLSATTVGLVTQGNRAETQTEYFSRATTILETLSAVLATSRQVENYILTTYPDVFRCKVYDLTKAAVFEASANQLNAEKTGLNSVVSTNQSFITDVQEIMDVSVSQTTLLRIVSPSLSGDTSFLSSVPSGHYVSSSSGSSSVSYTDVVSASGFSGPVDVIAMDSLEFGNIGSDAGFFTVFVCDRNGLPLSKTLKNTIKSDVLSKITAGLSCEVLDAFPVEFDFTVTISVLEEFGASSVATEVSSALESFMSLPGWPNFEQTLRIFDVVVRANRVPGVSYVYSVVSALLDSNDGAMAGNELLANTVTDGATITGYDILYAGVIPVASVEVVVV